MAPLNYAVLFGGKESVEILLQAGAAPDAPNEVEDRITPLANAINRAHVDIVKLLLDAGANVNSTEPGGSALMRAAGKESRDHLRIVQMLIAAGADVNGDQGRLLTRACMTGSLDNIKALVEAGADVNRSSLIATPLIKAIEFNRAPVVEFLLAGGADPSISAPENIETFRKMEARPRLRLPTQRRLSALVQLIQNRIDTTTSRRSRRTKKSDSPSESLESYWHRITEHFSEIAKAGDLKLLGPANHEEIEVVERLCGLTLPEDFKVAYRVHNGQSAHAMHLIAPLAMLHSGYAFLSLELIAEQWSRFNKFRDDPPVPEGRIGSDAGIQNVWWHPDTPRSSPPSRFLLRSASLWPRFPVCWLI